MLFQIQPITQAELLDCSESQLSDCQLIQAHTNWIKTLRVRNKNFANFPLGGKRGLEFAQRLLGKRGEGGTIDFHCSFFQIQKYSLQYIIKIRAL